MKVSPVSCVEKTRRPSLRPPRDSRRTQAWFSHRSQALKLTLAAFRLDPKRSRPSEHTTIPSAARSTLQVDNRRDRTRQCDNVNQPSSGRQRHPREPRTGDVRGDS